MNKLKNLFLVVAASAALIGCDARAAVVQDIYGNDQIVSEAGGSTVYNSLGSDHTRVCSPLGDTFVCN